MGAYVRECRWLNECMRVGVVGWVSVWVGMHASVGGCRWVKGCKCEWVCMWTGVVGWVWVGCMGVRVVEYMIRCGWLGWYVLLKSSNCGTSGSHVLSFLFCLTHLLSLNPSHILLSARSKITYFHSIITPVYVYWSHSFMNIIAFSVTAEMFSSSTLLAPSLHEFTFFFASVPPFVPAPPHFIHLAQSLSHFPLMLSPLALNDTYMNQPTATEDA